MLLRFGAFRLAQSVLRFAARAVSLCALSLLKVCVSVAGTEPAASASLRGLSLQDPGPLAACSAESASQSCAAAWGLMTGSNGDLSLLCDIGLTEAWTHRSKDTALALLACCAPTLALQSLLALECKISYRHLLLLSVSMMNCASKCRLRMSSADP